MAGIIILPFRECAKLILGNAGELSRSIDASGRGCRLARLQKSCDGTGPRTCAPLARAITNVRTEKKSWYFARILVYEKFLKKNAN